MFSGKLQQKARKGSVFLDNVQIYFTFCLNLNVFRHIRRNG